MVHNTHPRRMLMGTRNSRLYVRSDPSFRDASADSIVAMCIARWTASRTRWRSATAELLSLASGARRYIYEIIAPVDVGHSMLYTRRLVQPCSFLCPPSIFPCFTTFYLLVAFTSSVIPVQSVVDPLCIDFRFLWMGRPSWRSSQRLYL